MAAIAQMFAFHERPMEWVIKDGFDGMLRRDGEAVPLHNRLEALREWLNFVLYEPARQLRDVKMLGSCEAMMPALPHLLASALEGA